MISIYRYISFTMSVQILPNLIESINLKVKVKAISVSTHKKNILLNTLVLDTGHHNTGHRRS